MRRAPAKPLRSISTSSWLRRRFVVSVAAAALLTGGLLAWALPALAGPGMRGARTPARPRSTVTASPTGLRPTRLTFTRPGTTPSSTSTSTNSTSISSTLISGKSTTTTPALTSRFPNAGAPALVGRWGAPFAVLAPVAADLLPPLVTVSGADAVAVASGPTDEDAPATARAEILTAGASDVFNTRLVPVATQATLAAGFLGKRLVLVTGTSTGEHECCSGASTQVADAAGLEAPEPLVTGLEGASAGVLVPVRGGLLAAVDNQAGITVARSDADGVFSGTEQLVPADPTPPLMAAGSLSDGGALLAWTAPASAAAEKVIGTTAVPGVSTTARGYDQPRNRLIEYATAGPSGAPGSVKRAVTVPAGRQIDALSVIPHGAGVTLVWTESWFVANDYESRVFSSDVSSAGVGALATISPATSAAVGLSGAGSSDGGEVLGWQACKIGAGTCETESALRPSGGGWGPVRSLGSVDPTSFPVATQSRSGQSLIGWISNGVVEGATAAPGAAGFFPAVPISRARDASQLALSFGAGTRAAAVWVQGTYDQKLVGARFSP